MKSEILVFSLSANAPGPTRPSAPCSRVQMIVFQFGDKRIYIPGSATGASISMKIWRSSLVTTARLAGQPTIASKRALDMEVEEESARVLQLNCVGEWESFRWQGGGMSAYHAVLSRRPWHALCCLCCLCLQAKTSSSWVVDEDLLVSCAASWEQAEW